MFGRKIVTETEWKNLNQAFLKVKEQNNQLKESNERLEINLRSMWKDDNCDTTKMFKEFQKWLTGKIQFPMPTMVFKDFIREYKAKK